MTEPKLMAVAEQPAIVLCPRKEPFSPFAFVRLLLNQIQIACDDFGDDTSDYEYEEWTRIVSSASGKVFLV